MKSHKLPLALLFAAMLLPAAVARAEGTAHDRILQQRDAVLAEILAGREAKYSAGLGDDEDVYSAKITLLAFRRDAATSPARKIEQQELIVAVWEKKLAAIEARAKSGVVTREQVLVATDALLQARQVLEELRMQSGKG